MFVMLENDDAVCLEGIVAMVRRDGRTDIILRDNSVRTTSFRPLTLRRRAERFFGAAGDFVRKEREEQGS